MASRDTSRKLRVAICGGGIGGLCLAVMLSKCSHLDVQLYESAGQFKEIGAGVMIWSRTWRILEDMGLESEFAKIAHAPPTGEMGIGFDYRRSDRPQEGFRFKLVEMPYGCIRFHRADFLDVFINALPPGIVNFGKRLVSYSHQAIPFSTPHQPISLQFANGSTSACDLLIGADGIRSKVRAQMYREAAKARGEPGLLDHINPVWTGTIAYRGLVRAGDIPRKEDGTLHQTIERPMMYCGRSKHVVSYSISQGGIVNVVTFASQPERYGEPYQEDWVVYCDKQELLDCYAGWEPEVKQLLNCIEHPTKWAIHHLLPLPFYHWNGIVLLGDAVHAMAPHQGAGAGQAIEDAFILARLLSKAMHPTRDGLSALLKAYEAVRLPAANGVLGGSYESGRMYEFDDSRYGEDYDRLGPAIERQWDWIDEVPLEQEVETAFRIARKEGPCLL
ncbi:hypothetical protein NLJ89_g3998 [Agrocybe chaxingu]|uniref:FAD-binding domain-containing protein n=1 Tax=Agrocybe chaxingu TaxID=84603 RepID=A0A9W8K985_9AGAR|nr:hypothetical protein NLJ89_g3998 [Agrocybe chaxingu]